MITGKNKERFEEWLIEKYHKESHKYEPVFWNDLPLSMQWGVYLEYYQNIFSKREYMDIFFVGFKREIRFGFASISSIQKSILTHADEIANENL
jgi:hypothetical protein